VATPTTTGKREDKLPRATRSGGCPQVAQRVLEDRHGRENNALNAEIKTARHKARNLRKRATASAGLWDRTFETYSWIWPGMDKATWHLFE